MSRIVCIGNPVYDLISTPAFQGKNRVLSGCSTNACLALSRLGTTTHLIGNVGSDYLSSLSEYLIGCGIGFDLIPSKETGGFKLDYYGSNGDRHLSLLGNAGQIQYNQIDAINDSDLIILGPILGELTTDFVMQLVNTIKSPMFLDPQGTLRIFKNGEIIHAITDEFKMIASVSKIVKANELETQIVTGLNPRETPQKAVEELHKYGAEVTIVTLAEAGSIIFDGNNIFEIPPYSTNAVDPTGAGDTYAAGFCYQFLRDPSNLMAAGCFGSAVASIMVENSGPDFPLTLFESELRANDLLNSRFGLKL